MKTILILAVALSLLSCAKECNCTYYSQEITTANPTWKTTYETKWDSCEDEDFGESTYTHYDGSITKTHTFVKCK